MRNEVTLQPGAIMTWTDGPERMGWVVNEEIVIVEEGFMVRLRATFLTANS